MIPPSLVLYICFVRIILSFLSFTLPLNFQTNIFLIESLIFCSCEHEQAGIVKKEHIKIHGFWAVGNLSVKLYLGSLQVGYICDCGICCVLVFQHLWCEIMEFMTLCVICFNNMYQSSLIEFWPISFNILWCFYHAPLDWSLLYNNF